MTLLVHISVYEFTVIVCLILYINVVYLIKLIILYYLKYKMYLCLFQSFKLHYIFLVLYCGEKC